jgi:antitoxin FitA
MVPTITLKNIPAELHRELKKRAEEHHRSLNREILATLKTATSKTHRLDIKALIREARAARAKFTRQISDAEINAWKRAGRP